MVEENDPQSSTSEIIKRSKQGGKKIITIRQAQAENVFNEGKADEELGSDSDDDDVGDCYNFRTLAKLLEPVPKLTTQNYHSWSAHIRLFLRLVPHSMEHLEGAYNASHPRWSRTFDDALTNAT
ncbi:hypothetical protein NDA18_000839 [Ustilago nuda]|nr:hypothetical protein NDA18_000839 [Ustilago nuda]